MVLRSVALTGGSGLVGHHAIDLLSKSSIACSTTSRKKPLNLPSDFFWEPWDLSQWKTPKELDTIFPQAQSIFHIGAQVHFDLQGHESYQMIFDVNVRSCLCIAEWAIQKKIPIVFISTSTVYRDTYKKNICESNRRINGATEGFYSYSKRLSEDLLMSFKDNGLKVSILRPSSIYGYGLPASKLVTKFLKIVSRNEAIILEHPVDDRVNLIHAVDMSRAMLLALEYEAWGIFNIAGQKSYSILEIAETCVKVVGSGQVNVRGSKTDRNARSRFDLNCDKARNAFGFKESMDLETGLKKMWNDINKNEMIRH